jgi:hypothetical protein
MSDVGLDALQNQLAQAYTRTVSPTVRDHLLEAMQEIDESVPRRLEHCPRCERVGLPERVRNHDC